MPISDIDLDTNLNLGFKKIMNSGTMDQDVDYNKNVVLEALKRIQANMVLIQSKINEIIEEVNP